MEIDSLSSLEKRELILTDIRNAIEVEWVNPMKTNGGDAMLRSGITVSDIDSAYARMKRFAPLLQKLFPETEADKGMIDSALLEANRLRDVLNGEKFGAGIRGNLFIKMDSDLAITGSVKARGGIYEVLKYTEELAIKNGILSGYEDDYCKLLSPKAREFFATQSIQVGSTGNLGLSVGTIGAALGYKAIIHMSADAKEWKKTLLREKGAEVREYTGDYGEAVKKGRELSLKDDNSYFVDDENSQDLFLGYAVAGKMLKKQLERMSLVVDEKHPLFVYIPCGVGGAPSGIAFGLKKFLGEHVHCFFIEPTQAPCMLLGLITGLYDNISVQDIGLSGLTQADGLAVSRQSGFAGEIISPFLSGIITIKDKRLLEYLRLLWENEGLFIEPSACAAIHGPVMMGKSNYLKEYIDDHHLEKNMSGANHIVWATGGRLVPSHIREELLQQKG